MDLEHAQSMRDYYANLVAEALDADDQERASYFLSMWREVRAQIEAETADLDAWIESRGA